VDKYTKLSNLINLYAAIQNGMEHKTEQKFLGIFGKKETVESAEEYISRLLNFAVTALDHELGRKSGLFTGAAPFQVDAIKIKEQLGIKKEN
jgi:hypothetical protein